MGYCNYCGKEIDESNVYGNGIFCNKVCQIRKNSKAAVDAVRKVAERLKIRGLGFNSLSVGFYGYIV